MVGRLKPGITLRQAEAASIFGALALGLALIGVYGVMSYSAAQRTQEIGIRMALGAQTGDVLWLVLRQGMGLGLTIALLLGHVVSGHLFGITGCDPLTLAAVTGALTAVALLVCYVPARRATRRRPSGGSALRIVLMRPRMTANSAARASSRL
jgi:ABC-type antimicrobial peptide transport system permease subunit